MIPRVIKNEDGSHTVELGDDKITVEGMFRTDSTELRQDMLQQSPFSEEEAIYLLALIGAFERVEPDE